MKKVEIKKLDKLAISVEELEYLIYLLRLVEADSVQKIILENEFENTHKFAVSYLNDLLKDNLIKLKNIIFEI